MVDPGGTQVIAFDIGGTWFRSAVLDGRTQVNYERVPAASFVRHPTASLPELQGHLVDYLVTRARLLAERYDVAPRVGVSMGAALNATNGHILNSGPLWGSHEMDYDLRADLERREPRFEWFVLNDVTAGLYDLVLQGLPAAGLRRVSLVTVSTGIAARTFDFDNGRVPVEPRWGLQGEIGHLPVVCRLGGEVLSRRCDCGGADHLNAFASGRGITALYQAWAGDGATFDDLAAALARGDGPAGDLMRAVTEPLADVLATQFTLDPDVGQVWLTGGVVERLGRHYLDVLLSACDSRGLYQISGRDRDFFRSRIRLSPAGVSNLAGVAHAALGVRDEEKAESAAPVAARGGGWHVTGARRVGYEVAFAHDLLDPDNDRFASTVTRLGATNRTVVFVDGTVDALYGRALRVYAENWGLLADFVVCGDGERAKSWATVERIASELDRCRLLRRSEQVVAVGGGALLDAVGFACGIYRRGVPYIRVPTTLLGMVDAAVGVKTGVNFAGHKNRLGMYHPPAAALLDPAFLRSLPARHVANGTAEIIKIAAIADAGLFRILHRSAAELVKSHYLDHPQADQVLRLAVGDMLAELGPNLWEDDLHRAVDFGHTFSPAFELRDGDLLHGEAVALDMAVSCCLASVRRVLPAAECRRVLGLLDACGLPLSHPLLEPGVLMEALHESTVHRDGRQRIPVPAPAVGSTTFLEDVDETELRMALARLRQWDRMLAGAGAVR